MKFAFTSGSLRPQDFVANVQKAVENGLSKEDALRALTINAAEMFGAADQLAPSRSVRSQTLLLPAVICSRKIQGPSRIFIDGTQIELKKPDAAPARGGGMGGRPGASFRTSDRSVRVVVARGPIASGGHQFSTDLEEETASRSAERLVANGTFAIKSGRITGNQLRLTATVEMGGESIDAIISGTIEGDSIRGTIVMARWVVRFHGHETKVIAEFGLRIRGLQNRN